MKGLLVVPEMARAILRDVAPKTETRRVIAPQPPAIEAVRKLAGIDFGLVRAGWNNRPRDFDVSGPVWAVRQLMGGAEPSWRCEYQACERRCLLTTWAVLPRFDGTLPTDIPLSEAKSQFWHAGMGEKPSWVSKSRPGRFLPNHLRDLMPVVEIVSVRAERVQDIDESGASSEGLDFNSGRLGPWSVAGAHERLTARECFSALWDSINANRKDEDGKRLPYAWADNPWVWVITFKCVQ